jgi:uncharacterized membrane protein
MILVAANDWALFFGHFHPVLLHLPIGFMLITILLEIGRFIGQLSATTSTIRFMLFWSAISATLACTTGYLLSLGGGYEVHLLAQHQWQGIWLAVVAWVLWMIKSDWLQNQLPAIGLLYVPVLLLGLAMVVLAGHHGGSLTHGQGYLSQYTPEPMRAWLGMAPQSQKTNEAVTSEIKPLADYNQAQVYQDVVAPILKNRCVQCHNASKSKGDLRMDDIELLKKGGEHGPIFVSGKSIESSLIERCLLPLDDDEHMPPKGKPQLTAAQITLLQWWIDKGASFDKKVVDLQPDDSIKAHLLNIGRPTDISTTSKDTSTFSEINVAAPNVKTIDNLKSKGLSVRALSISNPHLLEVSAINAPNFGDEDALLLAMLKEQIVTLKLGNTKITDKALTTIAGLKNLQKIQLQNTAISDISLSTLSKLPMLEYINLTGTKISDGGLTTLMSCKNLKQIYLWQTQVTEAGAAKFKQLRPQTEVVMGMNEQQMTEFIELGDKAAKPKAIEVEKK